MTTEQQRIENLDLEEDEELEFKPCSKCDGHPACEDFGCYYELGLPGKLRNGKPLFEDDWT